MPDVDLDSIDQPDWLTDAQWEDRKADLRSGRFLSEILASKQAFVGAGANRRPFYAAKTEDPLMKFEPMAKAAGIAEELATEAGGKLTAITEMLMGVTRAIEDRKGGEGAEESAGLGEDIVEALTRAADALKEMAGATASGDEGGSEDDEGDEGDDDMTDEERAAKAAEDVAQVAKAGEAVMTLVQDKLAMIVERVNTLSASVGEMDADETQAKLSQLSSSIWGILDDVMLLAKSMAAGGDDMDQEQLNKAVDKAVAKAVEGALGTAVAKAVETAMEPVTTRLDEVAKSADDSKTDIEKMADLIEIQVEALESN